MITKEDFIRRTFELAKQGLGKTFPNPMVGAVIVKDGRIISEGFHFQQGKAHAELDAIEKARESIVGATIYINLEPCCHLNKSTPPCAQRLIKEGIKKVIISNLDPNLHVNGKGVELLRSQGIEVEYGIQEEEGEKLNEVFFLNQRLNRPFIHFKSAVTLDGKSAMTNGESKWITGEVARQHVHELRSLHQAIIVGGETVRVDNPKLTVRIPGYTQEQPWRIIFTKSGILPPGHQLFTDEFKHRTLIYSERELSFNFPSSQVINILNIQEALKDLYQKKIVNILLESGPGLATLFLKENLIDRISIYQNPSFLGSGRDLFHELNIPSLHKRPRLLDVQTKWIGDDHYLTGRLKCLQD